VLSFSEAVDVAQKQLTSSLGSECRFLVLDRLDEASLKVIQSIEDSTFRSELRYTREELLQRANGRGFLLIVVLCNEKPVAFMHGYSDRDEGLTFFLDSIATIIENRGIGSTLVSLALLHSLEKGYRLVTLWTEEKDDKDRLLRRFYEKLGFNFIEDNPTKGVVMSEKLDHESVLRLFYERVVPLKK